MYLCDCVYLAGLRCGGGGGVQDGGLQTPVIHPPNPPLVPVLHSEPRLSGPRGAESGDRAEGEILLICVEFYYFQLFGS